MTPLDGLFLLLATISVLGTVYALAQRRPR